jgi:hypothetical protein
MVGRGDGQQGLCAEPVLVVDERVGFLRLDAAANSRASRMKKKLVCRDWMVKLRDSSEQK